MVAQHRHHSLTDRYSGRRSVGARLTATAVLVATVLLVGCAGDQLGAPETRSASTSEVEHDGPRGDDALVAAAEFIADRYEQIDAASLSIADYLFRNWGVQELSGARAAALQRLAGSEVDREERQLARLVDPAASSPDPTAEGTERTTAVLAAALYCDSNPWSTSDSDALAQLVAGGGYDTTHAGLAVGWLAERECAAPTIEAVRAQVIEAVATELAQAPEVTDLAVEQSAILIYLGAPGRVGPGWSEQVAAAQRSDGGWGPTASNWHMTLLAIWTIEGLRAAGAGVDMTSTT